MPYSIQVKTPLERELMRVKGYGDAPQLSVVEEFKDVARNQGSRESARSLAQQIG